MNRPSVVVVVDVWGPQWLCDCGLAHLMIVTDPMRLPIILFGRDHACSFCSDSRLFDDALTSGGAVEFQVVQRRLAWTRKAREG